MGKRVGTGLPLGRLGRRRLCRVLSRTCLGLSVGCSKPAAKCCYLATNPICYHFGYEAHRRSLWAKQTRLRCDVVGFSGILYHVFPELLNCR